MIGEAIKTLLLVGIGAAAETAEKSKHLVDKLAKKGASTVEEGKILNEELQRTADARKREAKAACSDLHLESMTQAERDALRAKLDALDSQDHGQ